MLTNNSHKILTFLALVIIISGCSKQLTFTDLISDLPTTKNMQTIKRSTMNYDISLPQNFNLLEKEYNDTLWYELFVDSTIAFEKGANMISVLRYLSKEKTPETAWEKLLSNRMMIENFRIHSDGKTNFLNYSTFYEHASCTISNQNTESISFLVQGNTSDFYLISIQSVTDGNYPENLKQLLSSVKSFNIIP